MTATCDGRLRCRLFVSHNIDHKFTLMVKVLAVAVFLVLLLLPERSPETAAALSMPSGREVAELKPPSTVSLFGTPAISGNVAVVGAPNQERGGIGQAYIFRREGTIWRLVADLKPSDSMAGDDFGTSVGIAGRFLIVGAPDQRLDRSGRAYVFASSGQTWRQVAELRGSDSRSGEAFGSSVAIFRRHCASWGTRARRTPPEPCTLLVAQAQPGDRSRS